MDVGVLICERPFVSARGGNQPRSERENKNPNPDTIHEENNREREKIKKNTGQHQQKLTVEVIVSDTVNLCDPGKRRKPAELHAAGVVVRSSVHVVSPSQLSQMSVKLRLLDRTQQVLAEVTS